MTLLGLIQNRRARWSQRRDDYIRQALVRERLAVVQGRTWCDPSLRCIQCTQARREIHARVASQFNIIGNGRFTTLEEIECVL